MILVEQSREQTLFLLRHFNWNRGAVWTNCNFHLCQHNRFGAGFREGGLVQSDHHHFPANAAVLCIHFNGSHRVLRPNAQPTLRNSPRRFFPPIERRWRRHPEIEYSANVFRMSAIEHNVSIGFWISDLFKSDFRFTISNHCDVLVYHTFDDK